MRVRRYADAASPLKRRTGNSACHTFSVHSIHMFDQLAQAIEGLEIPIDGGAIGEVLALRHRLDARLSEALGEFAAAGLWELDGAVSLTSWLKVRGRMTARDASVTARRAERLRRLPVTPEAWADGSLSGGQVTAVMAAVRPDHKELFVEQEADVVGVVAGMDVRDTARVMNHWTGLADALVEGPEPSQRERSLTASHTMDQRLLINGDLDADSGEVVLNALRMAELPTPMASGAHRLSGGPMRWSTSAGSSLTIRPTDRAVVIGRT
jgi:hypothetical protein